MWRDTGRKVQVVGIGDAKVLYPFLVMLFFPSWILFFSLIVFIIILRLAAYKGLNLYTLMLYWRTKLIGKEKLARSNLYVRHYRRKPSANKIFRE